jgi:putative membrane protein
MTPNSDPQGAQRTHLIELLVLIAMVVLFAAHLGIHAYHVAFEVGPDARVPWTVLIPIYSSFSVAGALHMLGWRRALIFFGVTAVISFVAEYVGETTGLIFGAYEYTDVLRPKLLSTVPVVIPLAYFMLMYPSYIITNLILDGAPIPRHRSRSQLPAVALLTAMIMTAWDLAYDPLMARGFEAWVWLDGGPYYGIPFQNFVGWVATCFVIALTYALVEPRVALKPLGRPTHWVVLASLLGFAALGVGDMFAGFPEGTRVLAPFTMGVPVLAAMLRLYGPER